MKSPRGLSLRQEAWNLLCVYRGSLRSTRIAADALARFSQSETTKEFWRQTLTEVERVHKKYGALRFKKGFEGHPKYGMPSRSFSVRKAS